MANVLWNARLVAVHRTASDPHALANWYSRLLGDPMIALNDDTWRLAGQARELFVSRGRPKAVPHVVYAFADAQQLSAYRDAIDARGLARVDIPRAIQSRLGGDAFAFDDPDGRTLVFGLLADEKPRAAKTPAARLQHFVCASTQTPAMLSFYRDVLGFVESDRVVAADGDLSSAFVRSDHEHHSFAVFRAPQSGADHHAYEVADWNAIRDWADRCGDLEIPLWWGPGRHGVGNNLFFMIEDPEGYKVEFSAELEHMTFEQGFRTWPHGQRALNLWGSAWMRS
jgi:catechol 2,3-dioxygenase